LKKKELKTIKDLKKLAENTNEYDYVLDLHNNLRTRILSFFSKTPFIKYKKESLKRRLYTKPFFRKFIDLSDFNVLKAYQETLYQVGLEKKQIYKPKIILSKEEKKEAQKILPKSFIVIGTGARYKNKMYPFFDKVAEFYIKEGFNIVLVGSKEDKEKDETVYPKEVLDLRGRLSIRESLAVISNSLLTISNDSAVAHMARAVSIPVFMIYGATYPYFGFYPLPEEGDFIYANLPCQPCDLHGKKPCKFNKSLCLTSIKPEEIFQKSKKLVKNRWSINF